MKNFYIARWFLLGLFWSSIVMIVLTVPDYLNTADLLNRNVISESLLDSSFLLSNQMNNRIKIIISGAVLAGSIVGMVYLTYRIRSEKMEQERKLQASIDQMGEESAE